MTEAVEPFGKSVDSTIEFEIMENVSDDFPDGIIV